MLLISSQPTRPDFCSFISYRTGQYKLHYYETPTNIKFVMLTDTQTLNMRNVLHQIYVNLYVEFGRNNWKLQYLCGLI
jgi:hypothetical protein